MNTPSSSPNDGADQTSPIVPATDTVSRSVKGLLIPQKQIDWFQQGFKSAWEGMAVVQEVPGIKRLVLMPIILQAVISSLMLGLMFLAGGYVIGWAEYLVTTLWGWADSRLDLSSSEVVAEHLTLGMKIAVWTLVAFMFLWVFLIAWRVSGGILTGYYAGKITDKAMKHLGLDESPMQTSMFGEVLNGGGHALMLAAAQPVIAIVSMVPLVGPFMGIGAGAIYTLFITGYGELRDPLQRMGCSMPKAFLLSAKYWGATMGIGFSKTTSEPIPFIGGVVQASQSLGRIKLAEKIVADTGSTGTSPEQQVAR